MDDLKRKLLGTTALVGTQAVPETSKSAQRREGSRQPRVSSASFDLPPRPLARDERGLGISGPTKIEGARVAINSWLDPQELRFSLLFWDRLDFPKHQLVSMNLGPDDEFLQSAGVLQRTLAHTEGRFEEMVIAGHVGTFRALDSRDPGRWSMARGERSISFPLEEALNDKGILFELHQCIPVPDKEVPLANILEFRTKRAAELAAVRRCVHSGLACHAPSGARVSSGVEQRFDVSANGRVIVFTVSRWPKSGLFATFWRV